MVTKALELFSAYKSDKIPPRSGDIIFSYIVGDNEFTCYEIVTYWDVCSIHLSRDGLTFFSEAERIFVLVESQHKSDLMTGTAKTPHHGPSPLKMDTLLPLEIKGKPKILISQIPFVVDKSFCITRTVGTDFAFLIFPHKEVVKTICSFIKKTLEEECQCSEIMADKVIACLESQLDRHKR